MQEIKSLLEKISRYTNHATLSAIEKDLMLAHTRTLYEAIMVLEPSAARRDNDEEKESQNPEKKQEKEIQATVEETQAVLPVPTPVAEEETPAEEEKGSAIGRTEPGIEEPKEETAEGIVATGEEEHTERQTSSAPVSQEQEDRDTASNTGPKEEEQESTAEKKEQLSLPETVIPDTEREWEEPQTFELEPELKAEEESRSSGGFNTFKLWSKDIRSYIGINDKYNFISELFGGNAEAYEEILTELNQCESKADALQFLETSGITTLYKWKEDGFSENIFYNVLGQFFSAR